MKQDQRLESIKYWLNAVLETSDYTISTASSDASFRRYFRVNTKHDSWIVMDAPPDKEDTKPFIDVANFLFQHRVHVPEILAHDVKNGFLLLSDFGSKSYLDQLNTDSADSLYKAAIDSLIQIQLSDSSASGLAHYNQTLLLQEMTLFPDWFLSRHLSIDAPAGLASIFDLLIISALEQPQVVVHRDYHSRNLMDTAENSPGIIDFQDAVIGPISYDLVSLLRDCYIQWPDEKVQYWLNYYFDAAQQKGLLRGCSIEQFIRWFDWMGLQRHLKVLGIFCRLNYRDNKANYINDLPLTLHYVQKICHKYSEFSGLAVFLDQHVKMATP